MNFVVARRLEEWKDAASRAEAAEMFNSGAQLGEVLRLYPDAVPSRWKGKPVDPARRVIYAHYALPQEIQGEPDVNPPTPQRLRRSSATKASPVRVPARGVR